MSRHFGKESAHLPSPTCDTGRDCLDLGATAAPDVSSPNRNLNHEVSHVIVDHGEGNEWGGPANVASTSVQRKVSRRLGTGGIGEIRRVGEPRDSVGPIPSGSQH